MKNETRKNKSRGRPSPVEQLKIRSTLEECFNDGISPYAAERLTGHNINTVRKYYREFYKKITKSFDKEFVQGCKERIAYTFAALENDLLGMVTLRKKLEKVKGGRKPNIPLNKLLITLNEKIVNLRIKLLDTANSPTYDEKLKALKAEDEQK